MLEKLSKFVSLRRQKSKSWDGENASPQGTGYAYSTAPSSELGNPSNLIGLLQVSGLQKSYKKRTVVSNVNMQVRRGEAVGLLGPNGAGKTTSFYMITGLVHPDAGKIQLDGYDITETPMYQRSRLGIGYLPQEASIFRGLTVEDNIRAVLEVVESNKKKREMQLDALLEEFSITHLRKSPSIALSGGERRRCEIARALATRPSFMLLDEPFAGIDPIAVGDIQDLVHHLKQRNIGVVKITSSHSPSSCYSASHCPNGNMYHNFKCIEKRHEDEPNSGR